jgi:polyadenylate-binding protein
MLPRGRAYRYPPGRNMPDVSMTGVPGGMLSIPYDMGGMAFRDGTFSQSMGTGALATALANSLPEQQRTVSLFVCLFEFFFFIFFSSMHL